MIIANCPLRISLFGGSTDNPNFVQKYGKGSVISFTCDLKTYVTLNQDKIGYNQHSNKYILNYSIREEISSINEIKNELIRTTLEHFDLPPVLISLTSDVYSHGSGLASSSAYIISLVKAISIYKNLNLTDVEICSIAYQIELKFNPHCGYQDPYGCGVGGFKRINFARGGLVNYEFLPTELFKLYDAHLIFTGITRNSNEILSNISQNISKAKPLLKTVDLAYDDLINKNFESFFNHFNQSWILKKQTSNLITANPKIKDFDLSLSNNKTVIAHKLCGAGNGGFFLTFSEKDKLITDFKSVKISIESNGVIGHKL